MKVFIDNCVWDELYEKNINPILSFSGSEFSLHVTPDLQQEAEKIPDKIKKEWILNVMKQANLYAFFEFSDAHKVVSDIPSAGLGWNEGTFASIEQVEYIEEKMRYKTAMRKKTNIPKGRTDTYLSAIAIEDNNLVITKNINDFKNFPSANILSWGFLSIALKKSDNDLLAALKFCLSQLKQEHNIDQAYLIMFNGESELHQRWREYVSDEYIKNAQFLDKDFKLKRDFWGACNELTLALWLREHENNNFSLMPRRKEGGADFIINYKDMEIHLEATTTSAGSDEELSRPFSSGEVYSLTHTPIQERILGCIKYKCEEQKEPRKKDTSNYYRWLKTGKILPHNAFVLAIDVTKIPWNNEPMQLEVYIGAVFPMGHKTCNLEIGAGKPIRIMNSYYEFESEITKKERGSSIPKGIFMDEAFAHVSAIMISRISQDNPRSVMRIMIHNPLAKNTVPYGVFDVEHEITATIKENNDIEIKYLK